MLYCEPLVTSGRLYGAVPPLYNMTKNGKNVYFTDMKEYNAYIQKEFMKNNQVASIDNKPIPSNVMSNIISNTMEYIGLLENVATNHAINPYLLEDILINMNIPYSKFKKYIEDRYRFLKVDKMNGITILTGIVEGLMNNVFLNEKLLTACQPIIYILEHNPKLYMLNSQPVTLYTLLKTFENTKPAYIERNKGLGEMQPEQLAESTLYPGSNRTLIRYTVENIKKEIEQIRYIDSNRNTLLKDVVVTKEDVMG